jgi:hypothetical protein
MTRLLFLFRITLKDCAESPVFYPLKWEPEQAEQAAETL